jgi:predicted nucleic acid-binding protein
MICLDTNAVIHSINRAALPVRARINQSLASGIPVTVPTIALYELWCGNATSAPSRIFLPDRSGF